MINNKKKTIFTLLLCILPIIKTIAQNGSPSESSLLVDNVSLSNDLYKGVTVTNKNLFNIPVGNLTLENHFSNITGGFNPNNDESMFGINWYCNQFGQITREAPQDFLLQKYFEVTPALNYAGFGAPNVINLMNQDLTDCPSGKSNFSYGYTKFKVLQDPINSHVISDFKPAKYYFDFFGYKGYFVFDNDKKPLVYCETANLIVDMPSGFVGGFNCSSVTQPLSVNETSPEIRIQDDKGNNFYFGGSYDALEVNYSENLNYGNYQTIDNNNNTYSQSYACVTRANYIISWNLSKVVLANGDIILGKYKTGNSSVFNSFMQDTLNNSPTILSVQTSFPTNNSLNQANIDVSKQMIVSDNIVNGGFRKNVLQHYTKRSILQEIEVVSEKIKINYSHFKDSNNLLHLSGVNITAPGYTKSIHINQIPLGGQNPRYFLESIVDDSNITSFEYYKTSTLPEKRYLSTFNFSSTTPGTNIYGYWNGSNVSGNGNSAYYYDVTLLKKIIYPTKGFTMLEYELSDSNLVARIKKKIDSDGLNQYETEYSYKLDNGLSSLITAPSIYGNSAPLLGRPFGYGQVQEKVINRGETEYYFNSYSTNPNLNHSRKFNISAIQYVTKEIDKENERGKLNRLKIFDNNNNLLEENIYEYEDFFKPENTVNELCTNCEVGYLRYYVYTDIDESSLIDNGITNSAETSYVPVIPYLLKKQTKITFINGNQIFSEKNLKYRTLSNWHIYPIEEQNITTAGNITKKYLYADDVNTWPRGCPGARGCPGDNNDIVGGQQLNYYYMRNQNILTPIIEITKNINDKFSLKENLFDPSSLRIKESRISKLDATLSFTNYNIPVTNIIKGFRYDLSDDKGNYIQYTNNNIPTTVIFGYNQTVPIAKIEGATYAQVMQAFNLNITNVNSYKLLDIYTKSDLDINVSSENILSTALNNFRNNSALQNFQITTYTYDPLIGVTSITQPSGIREKYIYDGSNRLEKIVQEDGKILKEFKYNYKQ